jgi:hypothetical protein
MKTLFVLMLFALSILGVFAAVSQQASARVPYVPAHLTAPRFLATDARAASQALEMLDASVLSQQARLSAALNAHR